MDNHVLCDHLHTLGWLKDNDLQKVDPDNPADLEPYVRAYQAFHGLDPSGDLDPFTVRHMQQPRFCGHPDIMPMGAAQVCAWGNKRVSSKIIGSLSRVPARAFNDALEMALGFWNDVCGIELSLTNSNNANIKLTTGSIDGPQGTLAWSQMPCGNQRSLQQKYDNSEPWIIEENPRGGIDLVRVICHEVGHAIGIPHISSGNLMQPTYDPRIRRPQSGDIREAQRRYGPNSTPPPPPPPTPPDDDDDNDGPVIPDPDVPDCPDSNCGTLIKDFLQTPEGMQLAKNAIKTLIDAVRKNS